MKSLTRKGWAKAIVAVICFLALLSIAVEAACIGWLSATDAYSKTDDSYRESLYRPVGYSYALVLIQRMDEVGELESFREAAWAARRTAAYNSNSLLPFYDTACCGVKIVRYSAGEPAGTVITDRAPAGDAIYVLNMEISADGSVWVGPKSGDRRTDEPAHDITRIAISITLCEGVGDLISLALRTAEIAWGQRYSVYLMAVVSLVILMLSWIFLCTGAGRRPNDDEIHLRFPARVPLDLAIAVICALAAGLASLVVFTLDSDPRLVWPLGVSIAALTGVLSLLTIEWIPVSVAARIKAGGWWKNTLIFMILHLIWRILCAVWRGIASVWRKLPYIWRTVLFIVAVVLSELVFALSHSYVPLFILNIALAAAVIWYAVSVARLKNSAAKMSAGALGTPADTRHMPYELRCLGNEIGNMGKGLSRALDEKIKSERLKTELITNVSHDIKTPLTSIVNYVELLEREQLDGRAAEYVGVLSRQSSRMKKLIDDLIEASKASTGNIEAHPAPLDLAVMAGQTDGEYSERFAARDLRLVVTGADAPVMVRADGRLVWRIWDNLLGNICKYAMPGTRIYIGFERRGDYIATVFRNISEQPLEKTGDELTERFVRGDNSRSGDGSGLGLSIAAGLAAVQGGCLVVKADGDLFKVEVLLPAEPEKADTNTAPLRPTGPEKAPASADGAEKQPVPAHDPADGTPKE